MVHILNFDVDEKSSKLFYHKLMAKRIFKFINFDFESSFKILRQDLGFRCDSILPCSLEEFSKYTLMKFQHLYSRILGFASWSELIKYCCEVNDD